MTVTMIVPGEPKSVTITLTLDEARDVQRLLRPCSVFTPNLEALLQTARAFGRKLDDALDAIERAEIAKKAEDDAAAEKAAAEKAAAEKAAAEAAVQRYQREQLEHIRAAQDLDQRSTISEGQQLPAFWNRSLG